MTNAIVDYPSVNVTTATPATFTITPAASGTYYFGFNNYTAGGTIGSLLLDDILVTAASLGTKENHLQNNNVNVYPNPTSDYLYVIGKEKFVKAKILDASGSIVLSFNKVGQKIDVSQLTKWVYVLVIKNTDGTQLSHKFIQK